MKVEDLMIGDWIRCRTKLHGECLCQVADIEACHDAVWVNNGKVYGRAYETEIEPIPLTKEILRANFEKSGAYLGLFDEDYDLYISELTDGVWTILYHCCEINMPDEKVHVCYVYQLQHFLRHCGIDKEIKL